MIGLTAAVAAEKLGRVFGFEERADDRYEFRAD